MAPQKVDLSGFSTDVVEFIQLLARFKVRYLIVGGEAVIFHGYPRLTGDVDFFYECRRENAARLFRALQAFWSDNVPEVRSVADLLERGMIIQFGRPPHRIDLHNEIDGVSFLAAWKSRVPARAKTPTGFVPLFYIGLGPLRRNKRATGRAKDLDDLEHLGAAKRKPRTHRP